MDEDFQFFYEDEGFGPAIQMETVPVATIEQYRGKLPDQLLKYWELYGWSGYGQGLFWMVDPELYAPILEMWLEDTPFEERDTYYVIGRSAFGLLLLWGTNTGPSLKVDAIWGMMIPNDRSEYIRNGQADFLARCFFSNFQKDEFDQMDERDKPLFDRALRWLGPLAPDEMYGFEPALALGGKAELDNLRIVKAVPHLAILAQLGERIILRDVTQPA